MALMIGTMLTWMMVTTFLIWLLASTVTQLEDELFRVRLQLRSLSYPNNMKESQQNE